MILADRFPNVGETKAKRRQGFEYLTAWAEGAGRMKVLVANSTVTLLREGRHVADELFFKCLQSQLSASSGVSRT